MWRTKKCQSKIVLLLPCGNIKEDEVVYVGQSEDVPVRIRSHKHGGLIEFDHVYYLHVNPENLVEVEKHYIRLLKPKRNRVA